MAKLRTRNKPEKKPHNFPTPEARLVRALLDNHGNMTKAAKVLGISESAISQRCSKSTYLQGVLLDAKERLVDIAEAKLESAIQEGNLKAIIFCLKTIGKGRGWIERTEISAIMAHSGFELNIVEPEDDEDEVSPQ